MKSVGKIISLMIIVFMLLSTMMPVMVFAEEPEDGETVNVTTNYKIEAEKEWDVSKAGDGSAIAKWKYSDRSLTISGTGEGVIKSDLYRYLGDYSKLVKTLTIANGISIIDSFAFYQFSSLENASISDEVTNVGISAFYGCTNLRKVKLPKNIKTINYYIFEGCRKLEEIEYPEIIESVSLGAFVDCESLKEIHIPATVNNINSFYTPGIENIFVDEENEKYKDVDGVLYSKDGTELIAYPGGRKDKSYTVEETVTKIGLFAFSENDYIEEIILPHNLTRIESRAFEDCTALKTINLPSSLIYIGSNSFSGCRNLEKITIPEGVSEIYDGLFEGCSSLRMINLPEGITEIGENAFSECPKLTNIYIPESVVKIFLSEEELENIEESLEDTNHLNVFSNNTIPSFKTNSFAHKYAEKLGIKYILTDEEINTTGEEYKIKDTLTWDVTDEDYSQDPENRVFLTWNLEDRSMTISGKGRMKDYYENAPYEDYINLTNKLIIKDGGKTIENLCYFDNYSIEELIIEGDIEYDELGETTFNEESDGINIGYLGDYLKGLEKITLGATVVDFDFDAVHGLKEIDIDENNLYYCIEDGMVYSKDKKNLLFCLRSIDKEEIVIPNSVKSISNKAFLNCVNIKSVYIPNTVTSVGWDAFANCSGIELVNLPDGLKKISARMFKNCVNLKTITLPTQLEVIDLNAFEGSGIENIVLPEGLKIIESGAFEKCKALNEITIPKTVEIVGGSDNIRVYGTFKGCTSLENIYVEDGSEYYKSIDGVLYDFSGKTLIACPGNKKYVIIGENVEEFINHGFWDVPFTDENFVIVKKNSPAHKFAEEKELTYLLWNVESDDVEIENNIIGKINPNTKVSNLGDILDIDALSYKYISSEGNELGEDDVIGTNGKLILYDKIGYNFVVKGDLSGDGLVTVKDLAQVQRKILENDYEIDDLAYLAADKSGDGSISVIDLAAVQKYILTGKGL